MGYPRWWVPGEKGWNFAPSHMMFCNKKFFRGGEVGTNGIPKVVDTRRKRVKLCTITHDVLQ